MNNLPNSTTAGENKSIERETDSEERTASISNRESEAQLLLNLSKPPPNKDLYNKFTQQPNDNLPEEKEMADQINSSPIKHKLPILPIEKRKYGTEGMESNVSKKIRILDEKVIQRKDHQSQSDEILEVSTEDYNLLKFIKEKGLTFRQLCRLPFPDHQNPEIGVNNNTKQQLNLETPLVNLSYDDKNESKIHFHNSTNRLVALKLIEALQKFEKSRNKEKAGKQVMIEKRNLTSIINEVLTKIGNKNHDSFVRVSLNKMTQTEPNFIRDAECITADKSINKVENIYKHEANINDITNRVQAEQLSLRNIQFQVNEGQLVQQIQVISASAKEKIHTTNTLGSRINYPNKKIMTSLEVNGGQQVQQIQTVAKAKEKLHTTNTLGSMINYPNSKMMSALELTDQYYNYSNTWSSSFGAKGAGPSVGRPHRLLPPAATAAATGTASFPLQQSSGLNTQATTTGAMPPPYPRTPTVQTHTGPRWYQNQDSSVQPKYQPVNNMKNIPLRTAPYTAASPRFMPPVQGKYTMPEQPLPERFRTMAALQEEWASKLENYPNTAWDHSLKNNFNGNN